ncbi:MAG TPA: 30S ribosomal protein S4 [Candidatus Paceibacterota bacterium]
MFNTTEKRERSLGTKLFLKGGRCLSQKCATIRRPHRPGMHGKRRRSVSEVGEQLMEKQKIKYSYGIRESQMQKIFNQAAKHKGVTGDRILQILEQRLDNVVFRLGFALSRSIGRQLVGHGHITVNGRKVTIPSFSVRIGDRIAIRELSKDHPIFKELSVNLKKFEPPVWLSLDQDKMEGKVVGVPQGIDQLFDVNMVVDYYSK